MAAWFGRTLLILLTLVTRAAPGNLDPSFNPAPGPNAAVRAVALTPDGKIVIGGDFITIQSAPRIRMARLLPSGALDPSFTAAVGPNSTVTALDVLPNGDVLIAGAFTTIGTTGRKGYARLKSDSSLDATYAAQQPFITSGQFNSIKALPDGKALIAGPQIFFTLSFNRAAVMRLNADGSGDSALTNSIVGTSMFAQPLSDGRMIVCGAFTASTPARTNIVRLTATGALDAGFSTTNGTTGFVRAALPTRDDKIVIIGNFDGTGDPTKISRCLRLNADGSLDSTFATAYCDGSILTHVVLADGAVVIAGDFGLVNGSLAPRIARLTPSGAFDTNFNVGFGAGTSVHSVAVQNDGRILVAGAFPGFNDVQLGPVVRLYGSLDLFGPTFTNSIFSVSAFTLTGKNYTLEYKTNSSAGTWIQSSSIAGDGTVRSFTNSAASSSSRVYRLREN